MLNMYYLLTWMHSIKLSFFVYSILLILILFIVAIKFIELFIWHKEFLPFLVFDVQLLPTVTICILVNFPIRY